MSLRRRFFLCVLCLFLAVFCALSLTGCGGEAKDYIISYDLAAEPVSLDPQTAGDQASRMIISSLFEGLYTITPDGVVENALAQSHTVSPDRLRYTFTLRNNAVWSGFDENGDSFQRPVTARDFVFAFRRLLREDTASPAASQFYCIKNAKAVHGGLLADTKLGVSALSEFELAIELAEPNDGLLRLLASTYAMPCNEDFFESTRGKYGLEPTEIMANGAFDLRAWKHGESVRLIRNEHYYKAEEVLPAGVTFRISPASGETEQRLLDGAVDAAMVRGEDLARLDGGGFRLEPVENAVWGLALNQKNGDLSNENIRRGIMGAFDRGAYQEQLPENLKAAYALVPHAAALDGRNYRKFAGEEAVPSLDAEMAYGHYRRGLEELGKKSVNGLRLLACARPGGDASAYFQPVSQILQRELSLFISIEEVPETEYYVRLKSGDFDLALLRLESSDNTPWTILLPFQSGSAMNYISYQNGELDALFSQTAWNSSSEALELCREAERVILEDGVFIPMYYSTDYFVTRSDREGIRYNPQTGLVSFSGARGR